MFQQTRWREGVKKGTADLPGHRAKTLHLHFFYYNHPRVAMQIQLITRTRSLYF